MHPFLKPFRDTDYESALSTAEILGRLSQNVITGLSLYSLKPYYGRFSEFDFSVRRVSSRIKKQSLSATVEGTYGRRGVNAYVKLRLRPHPILVAFFAVFCFPIALFIFTSIGEAIRTRDASVMLGDFVPMVAPYLIFCAIFNAQFNTAQRFWECTLELEPIKPAQPDPPPPPLP